MTEQTDLEKYLAKCRVDGTDPKPSVVKILAGEDAAPVEPGFVPPAIDSSPERTTRDFLAQATADEYARLGQQETAEILAMPAFSREEHDEKHRQGLGRLHLGRTDGGHTDSTGTL
jgi:hypothetical protein